MAAPTPNLHLAQSVAHQHLARQRIAPERRAQLRALTQQLADSGVIDSIYARLAERTEAYRADHRFYQCIARLGVWDTNPSWLADVLLAWFELYLGGGRIEDATRSLMHVVELTEAAIAGDAFSITPARQLLDALFIIVSGALADFHAAAACRTDFDSGLPNRVALEETLDGLVSTGTDDAALMLVHIDGLMPATLSRAHLRLCIQALIQRLGDVVRSSDLLFAVSDIEFGVILPALSTPMQARLAASSMAKALRRPLVVDDHLVRLTPSIGIAIASELGFDATRLMCSARVAESTCRNRGGRYMIFTQAMAAQASEDARLEMEVIKAFNNNQLYLYLQPQVNIADGRCISAEALLRWNRDGVAIAPDQLLHVLHKAGHLIDYTHWLVKSVCRMASELEQHGIDISLSLNLFAEDFADDEIVDLFELELGFWKVRQDRLRIEIVEGSPVLVDARIRHAFVRLRKLGVRLSMDDFGAGYSSLLQLRQLPVDEIKLDRAFINQAAESKRDGAIVKSAVALAHALDLIVVAEGVETQKVLDFLADIECDLAQGYFFAQPMPLEAFIPWFQGRHGT